MVSYAVLLLVYAVQSKRLGSMAAELALDIVKTYSGRVPIRARFRYPRRSLDRPDSVRTLRCGKSTILRSVAGLGGRRGEIRFVSRTWLDTGSGIRVSPQDRHVGYMSQDYALFPTYTVAGNVEYGLAHLSSHEHRGHR